jgi:hypothetical protein
MRRVRRVHIPLVLHREVDDVDPGARQERSFLEEHGLCATVVEEKFISDQYFQEAQLSSRNAASNVEKRYQKAVR